MEKNNEKQVLIEACQALDIKKMKIFLEKTRAFKTGSKNENFEVETSKSTSIYIDVETGDMILTDVSIWTGKKFINRCKAVYTATDLRQVLRARNDSEKVKRIQQCTHYCVHKGFKKAINNHLLVFDKDNKLVFDTCKLAGIE